MRLGYALSLVLLAGCQAYAGTLEQALDDSLAKQDYRLIVRAGRGEVAPGIPAEAQADAKARCGVRYLDGLGDVIRPEQKEEHAKLSAYAAEYNQRMLVHCPGGAPLEK
ncbi:hypothetical protein [Aeromonas aquatica]|uniref:hypothetical protein n=1 Tax=Aeromonas aquatica TaxID=558964 RepID=UPI00286EB58F|nr:hypothetical protein [Aeromonas aquatica]